MFADIGYEQIETKGLGWISGKVSKMIIIMENTNFLIYRLESNKYC